MGMLISVFILCGNCAKCMKRKRIGADTPSIDLSSSIRNLISPVKAFRNLISGEDDELAAAYTHSHETVTQEDGAVRNATLVAVGNLQRESAAVCADVRANVVASERVDQSLKDLLTSTDQSRKLSESKLSHQCYQMCSF